MAMASMNDNETLGNENKAVIDQQELEREQVRREVKALVRQVADGYKGLENMMEQNPWLANEMDAEDRQRKRAFDDKLRKGLSRANGAPRCRWVYQGGTTCGSPQMRNHIYCYAHRQMMEARALALRLPAVEDANAIQLALMRVQKALIDDTISVKKAGVLFYSLQLAITNVGQTTFGKAPDDDLVMDTVEEEAAFREQRSAISEREAVTDQHSAFGQNRQQNQEAFTTEGTEGAEESKTLPLMNADDFDSGKADEQFVPMAGGYGYTRVRLRVGPEAGTPPRAAVPHGHGGPETHAKMG